MKILKEKRNLSSKIIKIIPERKDIPFVSVLKTLFAKNFISKFKDILAKELLVEPNSRILVAVSGGVDSISLLDAFSFLQRHMSFRIAIAHMNHQLRGEEAFRDEEFVKGLAEKYRIPFFLQRTNVKDYAKKHSMSIEEAARTLRYDFLVRAGQSFSANYIATAHNLNDQAETLLLNIIRGTGIAGLRGIASKLEVHKNLFIIRPFLSFSRQEIEQYANDQGLQWIEDSSNFLLEYTRNKIRHKLIPFIAQELNPQVVSNLGKLATIAQNSYNVIVRYLKKIVDNIVVARNRNEIEFDLENFKFFDDSLFPEIIQFIANNYFQTTFNFKQIENIQNLVYAETGKFISISKDIFVYKNRQKLYFIRKDKSKTEKEVVRLPKIGHIIWKNYFVEFEEVGKSEFVATPDPNVEFFDYDKIGDEIIIRTWEEGDRFVPLGMKKSKKLSDFFIDEKVPLHKKANVPIFVSRDHIFWVGGIRISDKFKVTKNTKRILKGKIIEIK